jgi:hypothetical protein
MEYPGHGHESETNHKFCFLAQPNQTSQSTRQQIADSRQVPVVGLPGPPRQRSRLVIPTSSGLNCSCSATGNWLPPTDTSKRHGQRVGFNTESREPKGKDGDNSWMTICEIQG